MAIKDQKIKNTMENPYLYQFDKAIKLIKETTELLKEIQTWMMDNDYECGPKGAEIYEKISKILGEEN